jgi:hypothetical protein
MKTICVSTEWLYEKPINPDCGALQYYDEGEIR